MKRWIGLSLAVGAAVWTLAGPAAAEQEVPGLPVVVSGEVEIGGRSTWGDDSETQFEKYRDLGEGVFGGFEFLVEDEEGRYFLRGRGENPGYEDQRYETEFGRYGRFKIDLFYKELPQVFSNDAMSLYTRKGGNEFMLPANVQSRIAGAADPSAQLAQELQSAGHVDLRFRQIEGGGGIEVRPIEGLTLFSRYELQDRKGSRAFAMDWGTPGGNFVDFAAPVDDQTHELSAGGEYVVGPASIGLDYRGSFYENAIRGVTADNPLIAADADGSPSRGRSALDPDNSAHMVNLSLSTVLPTDFPARVTGSFAYGIRMQDEDFLPHTINTALVSPTLPEGSLDGEVHTLLANVVATARPTPRLNLTARYRYYDYDNDTDDIRFDEEVVNDGSIDATAHTTVFNDFTTHNADAKASYRITDDVTGHLGYGFEYWRRSADRQVRDLWEHGPTAKLDWKIDEQVKFQGSYSFQRRDGDDYDTYSYVDRLLDTPGDQNPAGETSDLRKFDQAERDGHLADALVFVRPDETVEITFSGGLRYYDYDDDGNYGVDTESSWFAGWDAYWQACDRMGVGLYYSYEKTSWKMRSRSRSRTFGPPPVIVTDDAVNNWRSTTRTRTHTAGIHFDVAAIPERLDLRFGYEINHAWEKTDTEGLPDNRALVAPELSGAIGYDYPTVKDILQVVSAEATTTISEHVQIRTAYRYEDFLIRDFRTDDLGPYRGGTDIFLADTLDDYQAHVLTATAVITF
ncbi:MAG: MtrB/PioB family decaheme-associated outer membrane protein [Myxococcota bacterium]